MKTRTRFFPRSLALLTAAACLLPWAAGHCQAQTGTLTGAVMSPDAKVVQNTTTLLSGGVFVDVIRHDPRIYDPGDAGMGRGVFANAEGQHRKGTDTQHGGLYTFDGLKPGVYDVLVEAGRVPETQTDYRPLRLRGVVVKPNGETDLDITVHPGASNDLEVAGTPLCNTPAQLKRGWVEGTLLGADGKTVLSATTLLASGVRLTMKKTDGLLAGKAVQFSTESDKLAGGFFSAVNMTPGVYDITVDRGLGYGGPHYRPLYVHGVRVKPGVLTTLNLRMHEGDALERVTAPADMNGTVSDTVFKDEPFKAIGS